MKTRNGFVSNSSSSSFVVRRSDFYLNKIITSKKDEKKLESYGFRKTLAHTPSQVPSFHDNKLWKKEASNVENVKDEVMFGYNYGYEVTCNQDDVIQFLIKNKISFIGTCHYGHETVMYKSDTDTFVTAINFGEMLSMHDVENLKEETNRKPYTIISGKEWLKKQLPHTKFTK